MNNRISKQDDAISVLMSKIEDCIKHSDYVNKPRPLIWLNVLEELAAVKKSFLTFDEASHIAITKGITVDDVPNVLEFLNKMGVVLWLDEDGLRDVIILDIIDFFVEPITLILCNHISNPSYCTVYHKNIQQKSKEKFPFAWKEMNVRGVVARELINFLCYTPHRLYTPYIKQIYGGFINRSPRV